MRITRENLLHIARDTAAERVRINRRIVCIYLTGSLLQTEPLLGGAADIDLVIIHDSRPPVDREVIALNEDVHLDIAHYSQDTFRPPRSLRTHPWLGAFIVNHPLIYHDTQHWFEFTQAAITSQFFQPDNVLQRARNFANNARLQWQALHNHPESSPSAIWTFLKALEHAGNAAAVLGGVPLVERRFMLEFPARCEMINHPGLAAGLSGLLTPQPASAEDWLSWQPAWNTALQAASLAPDCPPRLQAPRLHYYLRSAAALFDERPEAALWIALRTWSQALAILPANNENLPAWSAACQSVGLGGPDYRERLEGLDAYLDTMEETLDDWGVRMGI